MPSPLLTQVWLLGTFDNTRESNNARGSTLMLLQHKSTLCDSELFRFKHVHLKCSGYLKELQSHPPWSPGPFMQRSEIALCYFALINIIKKWWTFYFVKACLAASCSSVLQNKSLVVIVFFLFFSVPTASCYEEECERRAAYLLCSYLICGVARHWREMTDIWCDLVWNHVHRGHQGRSLRVCWGEELIYFLTWFALLWK